MNQESRNAGRGLVIPSEIEGSRSRTFQLAERDSSTPLCSGQNDCHDFLLSCFPYLLVCFFLISACKREARSFGPPPSGAETVATKSVSDLHPAGAQKPTPAANHYEENVFAVSEGQKLFNALNCVGCHFHGGGGIGPALMDGKWIYGSEPQQIFASIVEGRPNGMPSFRGKIPDYQVWKLVAYVRQLGGLANPNAAPGRSDEMSNALPPNSSGQQTPANSNLPTPP